MLRVRSAYLGGMDDILRSYSRLSGQIDWLLNQRGVTEAGVADAIRAAILGEPLGARFHAGSSQASTVVRLACVWGLRAPLLEPTFLAMTPGELSAVSEGRTELRDAFAFVQDLERRAPSASPLLDRMRALFADEVPAITSLWSADGAALLPHLLAARARLQTPEGQALLDEAADALALARTSATAAGADLAPPDAAMRGRLLDALAAAGITEEAFTARLRMAVLGDPAAASQLAASGLSLDVLSAASEALLASLPPAERFVGTAARECGNFDHGVHTGVISAELLGEFLLQLFSAIADRQPIPTLGPDHLLGPQKWLCDLFVDVGNADPSTFTYVAEQCARIRRAEGSTAELAANLAQRLIAAVGVDEALGRFAR